jgi:hypothetical protein
MATGAVLSDYTTPANTQLQTSTSLKMDGSYCGVAMWGDRDDVPTAILLAAGNSTPAFTYTTPGSMFGIDVVHDVGASTPTNDVVYIAAAGKHVPANESK